MFYGQWIRILDASDVHLGEMFYWLKASSFLKGVDIYNIYYILYIFLKVFKGIS